MYDIRAAGILDFNSLLDFYAGFLPDDIAFVAAAVTLASVVVNVLVSMTAVYTWFERRALARFQVRMGPNRWGPFGILQPFADLIKLITKEDTTPETADRWVFNLAPIVLVVPGLMAISVIPFGQDTFLGRLNIGILFILGITSINTIAIFMAGWGSANKYAMLGSIRGVAMLVSYEVPMALSVTGVILISGSLAMFDIVTAQDLPFILVQPLSFLIFIAAASAEMSRTPFDQIEAESELGSGYNTEYSSMKFGVLFLAEFMAPLITAMIVTTLFLGGTRGIDPVPGQVWFVLKSFVVLFGLLWVRATWPRLRVDQIMSFAWKGLFGLALLNIFIVAAEIAVFQDEAGALSMRSLAIMSAINWVVTIVALVAMANILGQRKLERPEPVPSPLANMYTDGD
ncbi:MAG: NADH-quinone oxidoreductase subunit NuoH [SAR202 cluster bacterium]|jgi:NADH-quinone oxidoreductase subunit H|nr:NADH-quinone oxidoreductase subunit NuoH [SAR202 cluster bacterium]